MIDFSEQEFLNIKSDIQKLVDKLHLPDVHFIPISAKYGDNVVTASSNMSWYTGTTFLELIESIDISKYKSSSPSRFPVQTVIRPHTADYHDYRGYAGRVAGGAFRPGDEVTVLPSLRISKVKSIDVFGKSLSDAHPGDSVSISLEDDIDISRGDMLVSPSDIPVAGQDISLMICWFNERPLKVGGRYLIRINSKETECIIKSVNYTMNINTLEQVEDNSVINMNDIANVTIRTPKPVYYDPYRKNHVTGSMIFIDQGTNETVAAGMIR